jgi:FMN phosphatase YigB (HAD superfamily)
VQLGSALSYREVLKEAMLLLAESEGLTLASEDEYSLADSLPSWRPFPEVPGALAELRGRGFKLAILSNTDPELLDASLERIGVTVDAKVTAAEAGSYKPATGHWDYFFDHDIEPSAQLGLKAVWINRLHESSDMPREAELRDLSHLPDVLDEVVPVTA